MTDATLPSLREDLSVARGPIAEGAPTWSIYDPARHRYLRLDWLEFEILSRWRLRSTAAISRSIKAETTLRPSEDDIKQFAVFASNAGLLKAATAADTKRFALEVKAGERSVATWLLHNYLFLRLRLFDPDRLLAILLPVVRGFYSRAGFVAVALLGLFALFLVSRQWETYTHTFAEQTTFDGLIQMAIALSVAKVFHEFGHGFAAKRFGCRVPSMGVAFLVLWPVLWTDTTDAWRLSDRRQRLIIDCAGMATEIFLAALATIAWTILPDGPTRSAMFVLSSSTWLMTVFVNISPLMRFDGYYILSDLLDFPNLQERGFAYTRWFMREVLFRPRLAPPEYFSTRFAAILVGYSIASWAYRFFLFMGVALLVYHFSFKALGVVLMMIELWFFVARPIVRELVVWAKLSVHSRFNLNTIATTTVVLLLLAVLLLPWRGRVDAPGLIRSDRQFALLAVEPGRLVSMVPQNASVGEGEVIYRFESIEIEHEISTAKARLTAAQADQSAGAFNPARRRDQQATSARAAEAAAAVVRAEARARNLELRAPFTGEVRDIPNDLRVGNDIRRLERLGVLVSSAPSVIEAYVAEADLDRVAIGATARFIQPDGPTLTLVVSEVARTSTRALEVPELASIYEGAIPVRRTGSSGPLVPDLAIYRVLLTGSPPLQATTTRAVGEVVIAAPTRSAIVTLYRRAVAVFMREAAP